ncbi:hypothetical protein [Labrys okinawensis]|uniref:hypothetical protein n=1 Tax=Labrys okinawensis TaxID=346911 RepID=UPI003D15B896
MHVNLIENALQHAPGGSKVIVTTQTMAGEGGSRWIDYCVTDSRLGLAAEDLPHLFRQASAGALAGRVVR